MVKTIGILGGGQLAQMMTQAADKLDLAIVVIDTAENCPAAQVGAEQIVASGGNDQAALDKLVAKSDVITVEFEELFDVNSLKPLVAAGKPVHPLPDTIELIKDKLNQKNFLKQNGIAVGPFAEVTNQAQAEELLKTYGSKMVIKTRRGGYDGNGNAVVTSAQEIAAALKRFANRPLYAEQFVPFTKELAVMIARSTSGETAAYPVVQTRHERNICTEVIAPAPITEAERQKAATLALQVAEHLQGAGVFGVEMFLTPDGDVWVNEIAPRVHNSGHYTIEACETSQFEQHLRAITGTPLGKTNMKVPAAAMVNILGERNGPVELQGLKAAEQIPDTTVHIYGKSPTKIDRKMGHVSSIGQTTEEALTHARQARKLISI